MELLGSTSRNASPFLVWGHWRSGDEPWDRLKSLLQCQSGPGSGVPGRENILQALLAIIGGKLCLVCAHWAGWLTLQAGEPAVGRGQGGRSCRPGGAGFWETATPDCPRVKHFLKIVWRLADLHESFMNWDGFGMLRSRIHSLWVEFSYRPRESLDV